MGFELPSSVDMKGHAVSVMNHLFQNKELPAPVPVQFPFALRTVHGYQLLLINETTGIISRRGASKELLRQQEADQPHNEEAWAFVLANIERDRKKLVLQQFMFPHFSPYVRTIEIFTDWQTAVQNGVLHAASCAWTNDILSKTKAR